MTVFYFLLSNYLLYLKNKTNFNFYIEFTMNLTSIIINMIYIFLMNLIFYYRESYLRFCTQNFQLADLHESIHLCNNAIQCKYKNSTDRHPALPIDNMWDSTTFKQFLE